MIMKTFAKTRYKILIQITYVRLFYVITENFLQTSAVLKKVLYPCHKQFVAERFRYVRISSAFEPLYPLFVKRTCRKHQNRYMTCLYARLKSFTTFQTVHHRHHHITYYQIRYELNSL